MKREGDFSTPTQRIIKERSNYICNNPDCARLLIGPHTDPEKSLSVLIVSHICAASPGGARYDPKQTVEERKNIKNGILLCSDCSAMVDKDEKNFPKELLLKWKHDHEENLKNNKLSIFNKELINISTIQSTLRKDNIIDTKATFFRSSGPEWIDFEECFVFERKEVNDIIKKFQIKDTIGIKGVSASGKSVVSRNIGYKLKKEYDKDVYIIELKKQQRPSIEEVLKLHHCYLIIEDVHIDPEYVDNIVNNLKNVKVLLSFGNIEFGPISTLKLAAFLKRPIIIEAQDVAEEIVQRFCEKAKKNIPESIKRELAVNNLWILAWQLTAFKKFGRIDDNTVYKTIKDYIRDFKKLGVMNAEDIFLLLSIFYRHEIPLRKDFLEMFCEPEDIEKLLGLNVIFKFEDNGFEYLVLHHSETAEIFIRAFQKIDGFGYNIKKKFIGSDWNELFYQYMIESQKDIIDIIFKLGKDWNNKKGGIDLLKKLVGHDDNVQNLIVKGIDKDENIAKIDKCLSIILDINKDIAKSIVCDIDVDILSSKINNVIYVNLVSLSVSRLVTTILRLENTIVSNEIFSKSVISYLYKINDLLMTGLFIRCIDNYEMVKKLVPTLISKIEKEEDINNVFLCLGNILYKNVSKEMTLEHILNLPKYFEKINSTYIGSIIIDDRIENDMSNKVIKSIMHTIISKIEKEDIKQIWSFFAIYKNDNDIANEIFNSLTYPKRELIEKKNYDIILSQLSELPNMCWYTADEYTRDIIKRFKNKKGIVKIKYEHFVKLSQEEIECLKNFDGHLEATDYYLAVDAINKLIILETSRTPHNGLIEKALWIFKGAILERLGDYDEALRTTNRAIKLGSNSWMAWFNKGTILIHLGNYKDAIQPLDVAIDLCPTKICARINKCEALINLRRKNDVISCLEDIMEYQQDIKKMMTDKYKDLESLGYEDLKNLLCSLSIYCGEKGEIIYE